MKRGIQMKIVNIVWDEIESALNKNIQDKINEYFNQTQIRKKFYSAMQKNNEFFIENYGNKIYYNNLDKYIHNGNIRLDNYEYISSFYFTLMLIFLENDNSLIGENRFIEYHWTKFNSFFSEFENYGKEIKKFFEYSYNIFKKTFCSLSDENKKLSMDLKSDFHNELDKTLQKIFDFFTKNELEKNIQTKENSSFKATSDNYINDDNNEYIEKYNDSLFLEASFDDANKALLKDVYVSPKIDCNFGNWISNRDSRILLQYGKAGIGKTSFVSWAICKNYFNLKCHTLELRSHINEINSNKAWESLKKCFKCGDDSLYEEKILILDGLDEVCVLKKSFNGYNFINNLESSLRNKFGRKIRIIITSREGYFNSVNLTNNICIKKIEWDNQSVNNWCDSYSNVHRNKKEWCENFKKEYNRLNNDDKRKDIFCAPIILYICCVKDIDISKHDTVTGIYDEAFNLIGKRKHNSLDFIDENSYIINKQFTKEIAFQMFLNDKLEDILNSELVNLAKDKTLKWIKINKADYDNELEFKKLFALNHFSFNRNDSVEFAHKTVGEYFAALKIYEDYFKNIFNTEPKNYAEKMWSNIFQAFRYKTIPIDILEYLIGLIKKNSGEKWIKSFFDNYYIGIEQQLLFTSVKFESEYNTKYFVLSDQMCLAFRNLTWLLTSLGFNNFKFKATKKNLSILASYLSGDVNLKDWKKLSCINLNRANLSRSNFSGVSFSGATFKRAELNGAIFENASLSSVNLNGANLTDADFRGVIFRDVNNGGKLIHIKLLESDLPKYDKYVKEKKIEFVKPVINCKENKIYNPKTNRMEFPK